MGHLPGRYLILAEWQLVEGYSRTFAQLGCDLPGEPGPLYRREQRINCHFL